MRRIVTAISCASLALSMLVATMPAAAATGFDSAYAGESAFLSLTPGQAGTFTVFFANVGTVSWVKGTSTQVDLAACLDDKVTCNAQDASEAGFNSGWLSASRYASQTQTAVAPGGVATFSYNITVPNGATGTHHFNGAVVVSGTGADVHNEGYFQDVTVTSVSCTPTTITTDPTNKQETVGATHTQTATVTCANGAPSVGAEVSFAIQTSVNSLNQALLLKAVTNASGQASVTWSRSNPDVDSVSVYPTLFPTVRATASVQWVVQSVVACTPTANTNATAGGTSVIYTLTVRDPKTGNLAGAGNTVSLGLKTVLNRGSAFISNPQITNQPTTASVDTTTAVDTAVNTVTTDANGNATFTVSSPAPNQTLTNGVIVAPEAWLESTSFGGNNDTKADNTEFQVACGTATFNSVTQAVLTVSSSMSGTQAQGAQRVYTVTAADTSGNPVAVDVNLGFVEALLSVSGTNAVISWYDNGDRGNGLVALDADLRRTAVVDPARASTCDRVPNNTWDPTTPTNSTGTLNTTGDTKTSGTIAGGGAVAPINRTHFLTILPLGKATFAACSTTTDSYTPLAWQDVETTPDRIPQNGEPQAQGSVTSVVVATLSSGVVLGRTGNTSAEIDPTSASDAVARTKAGDGLEQFTFYMRNQSNNGFFSTNAQTVLWSVQNTGTTNVYIVAADGSPAGIPITVAPGQTAQVQTPIAASASTTCNSTNNSPDGTNNCFDGTSIWLNAGAATNANVTGNLLTGAASGTATKSWVVANVEPTEPAGVTFSVSGTVVAVSTTQKFYMLRTSGGTVYKITYAKPAACVGATCTAQHTSDTFVDRGSQIDTCAPNCTANLTTWEGHLKVNALITYTNSPISGGPVPGSGQASPTTGNAQHNITTLAP